MIAYSTMSQIGYMFVGVGLGAYGAGLFHLMTHAFFKALLFMAAGVVIHALAGEQDIRKMGGLGRELPWTYRFMLIGALALAAIPPFAGFFSKDAVLASAANAGTLGWILWSLGAVGAFLTGLYTFRMLFVVFGRQASDFVREHLHKERFEGPLAMMWPVAVLALLSVVGGLLQIPGIWHAVDDWIHPVGESIEEASGIDRALLGPRRARALARGDRARLGALPPTEPGPRARAPRGAVGGSAPRQQVLRRTRPTTSTSTSRPPGEPRSSAGTWSGRSSSRPSATSAPPCAEAAAGSAPRRTGSCAPTPSRSPPARPSSSSSS